MGGNLGRSWVTWVTLGLWFGLAGWSEAQTPGEPPKLPEPQPSPLPTRPLLAEPAVQRDLKLTPTQRKRLAELDGTVAESRAAMTTPTAEGPEGGFDFGALVAQAQQIEQERGRAVGRILTPAQRQRLVQLDWQREGWTALARPEVLARLTLRVEQKGQLEEVFDRLRREVAGSALASAAPPEGDAKPKSRPRPDLNPRNGFLDPTGGGPALSDLPALSAEASSAQEQRQTEAVARARAEAARALDSILDHDQKSAFLALLGPRFDFGSIASPTAPDGGPEPMPSGRPSQPRGKR